jgi:hypothetical protein
MQEVLEKILVILEAHDAKIKALEAQIEACGVDTGDIVDVLYGKLDGDRYDAFAGRHRAKFEPYINLMDRLEGGDSFRAIYEKSNELDGEEGYDEEAYINQMLAEVIEIIDSLKSVVPSEAQEALEIAEEAIVEAAAETQEPELFDDAEIKDPAPDEWSEEELEKERLEGRQMFR